MRVNLQTQNNKNSFGEYFGSEKRVAKDLYEFAANYMHLARPDLKSLAREVDIFVIPRSTGEIMTDALDVFVTRKHHKAIDELELAKELEQTPKKSVLVCTSGYINEELVKAAKKLKRALLNQTPRQKPVVIDRW